MFVDIAILSAFLHFAMSSRSSKQSTFDYGSEDGGSDCGSVRTRKGRKSGDLCDGAGANIDMEEFRRCKRVVAKAIQKSPQAARRLCFLVEQGKLGKAKTTGTGDMEVLPPCANKWTLLGAERIRLVLKNLCDEIDMAMLNLMKLEDLKELINYALALCRKGCSVTSKVWGQLKFGARERYAEIKGNRLKGIVFVRNGDKKAPYAEVDYGKKGCYSLGNAPSNKKKFTKLLHVSGAVAKLNPPCEAGSYIVQNDDDHMAKIVNKNNLTQIVCKDVFKADNQESCIPDLWADERVGQCKPSPVKASDLKELCDGVVDEAAPIVLRLPAEDAVAATPPAKKASKGRSMQSSGPPAKRR